MRILLLGSKEYPFHSGEGFETKPSGGIEVHVEKLAKYLGIHGDTVFIITRRFPNQKRYESGQINVLRVPFINNPFLRTMSFNFFSFFRALQIIGLQKIELIHSHGQVAGFFGSLLSKISRKPLVYTPHGVADSWRFPIRNILHLFDRVAIKSSKKVLFISPREKEMLSRYTKSYALLSNAIDFDDYKEPEKHDDVIRFLFVGRLVKEKGILLMLQAFERLQNRLDNVELVVAGTGPMRVDLERFIRSHPNLNIKYLGWRRDIPKLLSISDAFILASQEKGQPVALLEAMAAGKVVITSLPYVEERKTGLRFRPLSVDGLYKKMLFVCQQPSEAKFIGDNAKESVRYMGWNEITQKFITEYKSVL